MQRNTLSDNDQMLLAEAIVEYIEAEEEFTIPRDSEEVIVETMESEEELECEYEIELICSKCNKTTSEGKACEGAIHPTFYYGRSILSQIYCPNCSYKHNDSAKIWCSDCVNIKKLLEEMDQLLGEKMGTLIKYLYSCEYPDNISSVLFHLRGVYEEEPIIGILTELYMSYKNSIIKDKEWRENFIERVVIALKGRPIEKFDEIKEYLIDGYESIDSILNEKSRVW